MGFDSTNEVGSCAVMRRGRHRGVARAGRISRRCWVVNQNGRTDQSVAPVKKKARRRHRYELGEPGSDGAGVAAAI